MYTFSYIGIVDYTADGGPKLYQIQDDDTSKQYFVDYNLVASSSEAIAYIKKYGIVRYAGITAATKTKITYDARGIVTAGADATTADIVDSTNKRYVTDAQLVVIGNTSGTNTGDQTLGSLGAAASGSNSDITALNNVLTTLKATQTGFKIQDTSTKLLTIKNDNTLTANRTLSIQVADADRTIALSGNLTVSSAATVSGTNTGDQTLGSLGAAASGANTDITSVLLNQTGLVVKGGSSNALTIKPNETLTAGRTLNIKVNDVDRTIDLSGNLTVSGAATISGTNTGDQTITLTGNVTGSGTGSISTVIAAGVVTEAMQTLADNTTNDVSTSKHGYVPKAPNDASKKLDGTGAWSNGWIIVFKTSDQTKASNTTLATDSALSFSMDANTKYRIKMKIFFGVANTSMNFKYALTGPASPTQVAIVRKIVSPAALTTLSTTSATSYTASTTITIGSGSTGGYMEWDIYVSNGINAGTFGFQWAQGTSSGSNATVYAGSSLEYTTVA